MKKFLLRKAAPLLAAAVIAAACRDDGKVLSVMVSPDMITAASGSVVKFKVTVEVSGKTSKQVTWSVNGADGGGISGGIVASSIDANGLLTVADDETAAALAITATSVADPSKKGIVVVVVTVCQEPTDWGFTDNLVWTLCPGGVLSIIGDGAMSPRPSWYKYNSLITSVSIADGVTSVGKDAFYECVGLTSLTIGASVTYIGDAAFFGCRAITGLSLPASVTYIGVSAFYECTGLAEITSLNPNPPTVSPYAFKGIDKTACTLRVPAGSGAAYRAVAGWKDFVNIVEIEN